MSGPDLSDRLVLIAQDARALFALGSVAVGLSVAIATLAVPICALAAVALANESHGLVAVRALAFGSLAGWFLYRAILSPVVEIWLLLRVAEGLPDVSPDPNWRARLQSSSASFRALCPDLDGAQAQVRRGSAAMHAVLPVLRCLGFRDRTPPT